MKQSEYEPGASLGFLVAKLSRAVGKRLTRNFNAAGFDITAEQWKILLSLWNDEGRTQQELAECADKDKTTITRIIDGLEKRNLVVRIPDRDDRRIRRIYLTRLGREIRQNLQAEAIKTIDEAQSGIPDDQLRVCKDVLYKAMANLCSLHEADQDQARCK